MIGPAFWDEFAKGAAGKWADRILSPALLFWAAGVLAFVAWKGPATLFTFLGGLDPVGQILLAAGGLALVAMSARIVEAFETPALRILEGYWPRVLRPLSEWKVRRITAKLEKKEARQQALTAWWNSVTPVERAAYPAMIEEYRRLDVELANYPSTDRLLPTRLGNVLRAAEDYPYAQYGLSTGVAWPRLWLVMPNGPRKEIGTAREALGSPVRVLMWSCLVIVWPLLFALAATRVAPAGSRLWTWLILAAAVAGVWWGYTRAVEAAKPYGDLLRAAFDVHRVALYESLGWPITHHERARGEALTQYLWHGDLP